MSAPSRIPETTHRIAAADCDAQGELTPAHYLEYLLAARAQHVAGHYAATLGVLAQRQNARWLPIRHLLAYLRPAAAGDEVRIRSQIIHFDNSRLVVEVQLRNAPATRLLALLWAEMKFVSRQGGHQLDHADDLMELLEQLDAVEVDYHPDGFDERVQALRRELKNARKRAR